MKKLFRILVILLVLTLIFSFVYESVEKNHHDCAGEHCPICAILAVVSAVMLCLVCVFVLIRENKRKACGRAELPVCAFVLRTLVTLRTKLSD